MINSTDLSRRELACVIPILLMVVWMGVYSAPFLRRMDSSVSRVIEQVSGMRRRGSTIQVDGAYHGLAEYSQRSPLQPRPEIDPDRQAR